MKNIRIERSLDMRYRGQSYELIVPYSENLYVDFHRLHEKQYGYANNESSIEIVNLRVRAVGLGSPPPLLPLSTKGSDPSHAFRKTLPVVFATDPIEIPFYQGEALEPGNLIHGPAMVVRSDTTILVPPTDQAVVDVYGNLLIEVGL